MPLLLVDLAFLAANIPKIPHGGWFPLLVGLGLVVQMTTWRRGPRARRRPHPPRRAADARGRRRGARRARRARAGHRRVHVQGRGARRRRRCVSNLRHNNVLHETTLLVSVHTCRRAARRPTSRASTYTDRRVGHLPGRLTFGFMDEPDVPDALATMDASPASEFDLSTTTYFLGRESVVAGKVPGHASLA